MTVLHQNHVKPTVTEEMKTKADQVRVSENIAADLSVLVMPRPEVTPADLRRGATSSDIKQGNVEFSNLQVTRLRDEVTASKRPEVIKPAEDTLIKMTGESMKENGQRTGQAAANAVDQLMTSSSVSSFDKFHAAQAAKDDAWVRAVSTSSVERDKEQKQQEQKKEEKQGAKSAQGIRDGVQDGVQDGVEIDEKETIRSAIGDRTKTGEWLRNARTAAAGQEVKEELKIEIDIEARDRVSADLKPGAKGGFIEKSGIRQDEKQNIAIDPKAGIDQKTGLDQRTGIDQKTGVDQRTGIDQKQKVEIDLTNVSLLKDRAGVEQQQPVKAAVPNTIAQQNRAALLEDLKKQQQQDIQVKHGKGIEHDPDSILLEAPKSDASRVAANPEVQAQKEKREIPEIRASKTNKDAARTGLEESAQREEPIALTRPTATAPARESLQVDGSPRATTIEIRPSLQEASAPQVDRVKPQYLMAISERITAEQYNSRRSYTSPLDNQIAELERGLA